jgi:hypothetical protein
LGNPHQVGGGIADPQESAASSNGRMNGQTSPIARLGSPD